MQTKRDKNILFVRLFTDEDINKQLKEACKLHKVKTAVVLSGIGQLKTAKLGYFKMKGDYTPKVFDKPLEILSLTGNISKDDNGYNLHLHAILGDEKKNAIGGHFVEGTIGITGEIVLLKIGMDVKRKLDEETGLKGLYLE